MQKKNRIEEIHSLALQGSKLLIRAQDIDLQYIEGVEAALSWVLGHTTDTPVDFDDFDDETAHET